MTIGIGLLAVTLFATVVGLALLYEKEPWWAAIAAIAILILAGTGGTINSLGL